MTAAPYKPGDKLRVTEAVATYTPHLAPGDLVTVIETSGVRVEQGRRIEVVKVSTAHGPQILGLDAVEPYTPPGYTPAEPDDVVDAFFFSMLGADDDLRDWAVKARTELAANDPDDAEDPVGGGGVATAVEEGAVSNRHRVGQGFSFTDAFGDTLSVSYFEQDCETHGREGIFLFTASEDDETGRVAIPADQIEAVIKYLFTMKKHSDRPGQ